jgi:YebC/PmpR family DNA-binding regulatory protein
MSGHSKWSTIKRKKAATDAKRGKLWTKVLREIQLAARLGGAAEVNPRLRNAILTAKSVSVSGDAIERAVKRGLGAEEGQALEEILYEGYGPGGVAVIIKALSDNRNRTASEVRHALSRSGGSLGGTNSVAYIFQEKGIITVPKSAVPEEKIYEAALEAGADDIADTGEHWEVTTTPGVYDTVRAKIEGILPNAAATLEGAVKFIPNTTVLVSGDVAGDLIKMMNRLDDLDDVQEVIANFEMDEAELTRLSDEE